MINSEKMRIAVFASGNGTNAENLIRYFKHSNVAEVSLILTNNPAAYVLQRALSEGVSTMVINRDFRKSERKMLSLLSEYDIGFIVLAGYLLLIPPWLVAQYRGRIVNIHPALLPRYGGKGMYGEHVHKAVLQSGDKESGITIHYVNEQYDQGDIIFQAACPVLPGDTHESLAARIHALEYEHFPRVIDEVIKTHSS